MSPGPALGLYVHWPYCARICPYCDFNVVRARGREAEAEALGAALLRDLQAQASRAGRRRLVSIHFGGGTPSLMPPALVAAIIASARRLFEPADDLEIGLEANPVETARFPDLRAAGVDRLSLGLQSLDDAALQALGRDHDARAGLAALEAALALFPRVSADLIYGRPDQSLAGWREELARVIATGVGHLSAYQLTYEPDTAFGRARARGRMAPPPDDLAADFDEATADVLTTAGFDPYEVSNWARSEADRSRHNLVYWRGLDYLGVGPGAHGRLTLDGVRLATAGARKVPDFLTRVGSVGEGLDETAVLSPLEQAEERLILGLRIAEGVAYAEAPALAPDDPAIRDLVDLGLLADDPARLRATPAGRRVLDSLTSTLVSRLRPPPGETPCVGRPGG